MIRTKARLRAWGNSVGIVIPKEQLKKEGLETGENVTITLERPRNPLESAFGVLKDVKGKSGKSTAQILKEIDDAFDE